MADSNNYLSWNMTLSIPQVTLPQQIQSLADQAKAIDYRKHYNRILTICLTIAAWTWVILKYTKAAAKWAAPRIITILRWLADQIEYLVEGNTQPQIQLQQASPPQPVRRTRRKASK